MLVRYLTYKVFIVKPFFYGINTFMKEKKMFATRIDKERLKNIKHLSVNSEKPINALLEEAIDDLLKKYEKSPLKKK